MDLDKSFDNAIAYYKGERKEVNIEKCITVDKLIEKLSALMGLQVNTYCDTKKLRDLTNRFLQKQPIGRHELLGCFNFNHFLLWMGCKNDEIEETEKAFRGMISLIIDIARNDKRALKEILAFCKFYGELQSAKIYTE